MAYTSIIDKNISKKKKISGHGEYSIFPVFLDFYQNDLIIVSIKFHTGLPDIDTG